MSPESSSKHARSDFKEFFGFHLEHLSGEGLMSLLKTRFDAVKILQYARAMDNTYPWLKGGYVKRQGCLNDKQYEEQLLQKHAELDKAVKLAQPFVKEDLSFLDDLAEDEEILDNSGAILQLWDPDRDPITEAQKAILRGDITIYTKVI